MAPRWRIGARGLLRLVNIDNRFDVIVYFTRLYDTFPGASNGNRSAVRCGSEPGGSEGACAKRAGLRAAGSDCAQGVAETELSVVVESAMRINDQPPKNMLIPMSNPMAQAAVPGSPANRMIPNVRSTMPLAST